MSFTIKIDQQDKQFATVAENDTILDAALKHGVVLPYSCRGGTCGSCKGKVVSGEWQYPEGDVDGLSQAEKDAGYVLFCQAQPRSDLVIEAAVRAPGEMPLRRMACRVAELNKLCHDVMQIKLKLPGDERLMFLAGQYIDFVLKDGSKRGFSLANAPHEDEFLELHIRYVPGGTFTEFVFKEMKVGSLLRFEGPCGQFYLREESERPIIMMAGGTGFAPIKGIIEHAKAENLLRPIHFFWGVRAKRDLYLHDVAQRYARELPDFQYTPVLSEPHEEDHWQGEVGWVHEAVVKHYGDLTAFDVYMGGPPPMVEAAKALFGKHGLPPEQMFYDSFEFAKKPT